MSNSYPTTVEQVGTHDTDDGVLRVYVVKAGSIIHIGGLPCRVTVDARVETATDLVRWIADVETGPHPAPSHEEK